MQLYSTSNPSHKATFSHAVLQGLASDGGLYMLPRIAPLSAEFFHEIAVMDFPTMSVRVMQTLLADVLDASDYGALEETVRETVNFDAPLVRLSETISVVELFHGPTLAFKDFGARFMARMMRYLREKYVSDTRELTVLVATSGDTGSAVARGFWKIPGIRVVILYPQGKVSHVQEQQLTTMGENIAAIEVEGTFDDCQAMVKTAFQDAALNQAVALTSANSINIARLLPQSLYYFRAYSQLAAEPASKVGTALQPPVFCTPSGNFGNLTAGMFAKKMGLPVSRFVAGVNRNDTMAQYLLSGTYSAKPSVSTPSNAMDVGNPSNFARMNDLYGASVDALRGDVVSYSVNDEETLQTVKDVHTRYGYVMCPHTAVGYAALERFAGDASQPRLPAETQGIILATAHPAKFGDVVEPVLGVKIEVPPRLQEYLTKEKIATVIPNDYARLKAYLLERA
jgi:threonine synthase